MARRRKKDDAVDPAERTRLKKLRAAQRREERKKRRESGDNEAPRVKRNRDEPLPVFKSEDMTWLRRDQAKAYAMKILNNYPERPYWLSIAHGNGDGNVPVAEFYPCTIIRTKTRAYYGFLFREHRDMLADRWLNATKEVAERVRRIAPHINI